jgi:hypothetical protein
MGLLGDMLAGAADRGGAALEKAGLVKWEADVREEAAKRLEEHRSRLAEDSAVRAEQRGIENRKTERGIIHEETKARAADLTAIEVDRQLKVGMAKNQVDLDKLKAEGPERIRQAVQTQTETLAAMSTPEALKQARSIALAKHIVDPSYQLVPLSDGTIATVDTKSGKSGGVLKGADGEPLVRKDSEELKAATEALRFANQISTVANASYRATINSPEMKDIGTDPATKERVRAEAEATLASEKKRAEELAACAIAVLMRKGKATPPKVPGLMDAGPESYPGGGEGPKPSKQNRPSLDSRELQK